MNRDMELQKVKTESTEPFVNKVDRELKRAERYSIFVSVLLLDLSSIRDTLVDQSDTCINNLCENITSQIREIDECTLLTNDRLAFLFPETDRQGAEIASKRLIESIKKNLSQYDIDDKAIITPETVSFPNTAGAKTLKDLLQEISEERLN